MLYIRINIKDMYTETKFNSVKIVVNKTELYALIHAISTAKNDNPESAWFEEWEKLYEELCERLVEYK